MVKKIAKMTYPKPTYIPDDTPIIKRPAPKKPAKKPTRWLRMSAIDKHVGSRIKLRRTLLGMTQKQLAAAIGTSIQQTHDYEIGIDRIGAGRLYDAAQALGVPVSFFFEEISSNPDTTSSTAGIESRLLLNMFHHYNAIPEESVRNIIYHTIKSASGLNNKGWETEMARRVLTKITKNHADEIRARLMEKTRRDSEMTGDMMVAIKELGASIGSFHATYHKDAAKAAEDMLAAACLVEQRLRDLLVKLLAE